MNYTGFGESAFGHYESAYGQRRFRSAPILPPRVLHTEWTDTSVPGFLPITSTLPRLELVGTSVEGTTTVSPAWPAGHAANDIGILLVVTANRVATLTDAQGFVAVTNSPQGTGGADTNASGRITMYWARASSGAMAAPTITNGSALLMAGIIYVFRGCVLTGDPWNITSGDVDAAGSTAVAIPGATTTVKDCTVLVAGTDQGDSLASQIGVIGNSDLEAMTRFPDARTTNSVGKGLSPAVGYKRRIGAYGTSDGTLVVSSVQGRMSIALMPVGNETESPALGLNGLLNGDIYARLN